MKKKLKKSGGDDGGGDDGGYDGGGGDGGGGDGSGGDDGRGAGYGGRAQVAAWLNCRLNCR